MNLPAPHLDDRRFQQLVDEAKRLVQRRCPDWTDHNVSDPGVTLIEAFAFMVDQLLYRVNRIPDRNYVKFLDMIGLKLLPPTAARAHVTFWLSAPQQFDLDIPVDTEVATRRTEGLEPVTFATVAPLKIVHVELERAMSSKAPGDFQDHTNTLMIGQPFYCFDSVPKPDDALYVGLSQPAPSNVLSLRLDCEIEGVGVDPTFPPIAWEAWTGDGWERCDVEEDGTGGLNRPGEVVLHLPSRHRAQALAEVRAAWVRCRVIPTVEFQPAYSASPKINSVSAATIGGTVQTVNALRIANEVLGESEGVAHQVFNLQHVPVVPWDMPVVVEVSDEEEGWSEWRRVESFADSGPNDRVFALDETSGTITFGPAVIEADGRLRQYGAVPEKKAVIRVVEYRSGGGRRGTVARGTITSLSSSIPYVSRVGNRSPAVGGVDGESLEDAKKRGPILLRTRDRAVTAEDFEHLAREHCPDVARVRAVPAGGDTNEPAGSEGGVRVLVVPSAAENDLGQIDFLDMYPPPDLVRRVAEALDERRVLGTRVSVEPVRFIGFTVVASVRARPKTDLIRLERACVSALYRHFHPITGGPNGTGWDFGRQIAQGEVYAVLQRVRGVELVEQALLFTADPINGTRSNQAVDRIPLGKHDLPFSYDHTLRIRPSLG